MGLGEFHVGQHFVLGAVHQAADFRELAAQLFGHHAPTLVGVLGRVLGEDGGNGCADHAPLRLAGVGQPMFMQNAKSSQPHRVN
jgi:hypothetical protein